MKVSFLFCISNENIWLCAGFLATGWHIPHLVIHSFYKHFLRICYVQGYVRHILSWRSQSCKRNQSQHVIKISYDEDAFHSYRILERYSASKVVEKQFKECFLGKVTPELIEWARRERQAGEESKDAGKKDQDMYEQAQGSLVHYQKIKPAIVWSTVERVPISTAGKVSRPTFQRPFF